MKYSSIISLISFYYEISCFFKCFFVSNLDNYVVVILFTVNIAYCINWFSNVILILHSWDKGPLVIMMNYMLLNLISFYYHIDFCVSSWRALVCTSKLFFFCLFINLFLASNSSMTYICFSVFNSFIEVYVIHKNTYIKHIPFDELCAFFGIRVTGAWLDELGGDFSSFIFWNYSSSSDIVSSLNIWWNSSIKTSELDF